MQDNNDNNLFTQMFGLETEEPKVEELPSNNVQEKIETQTSIKTEENINNNNQQIEESSHQQNQVITSSTQEKSSNLNQLNFSSQNNEVINLSSSSPQQTAPTNTQIELSSNDNYPTQTYSPTNKSDIEDFTPFEKSDIKNGTNALAQASIILILILILCGSWFFIYNTFINVEEELTNAPQENNDIVDDNQLSGQGNKQEEKTITFDETLSFYNGLTNNSNELNQKVAYTPTDATGVIKCSSTENVLIDSSIESFDLYFYYQNYQLKKFLLLNKAKYSSESDYQLLNESCNILMENFETSEGVKYKCNLNKSAREIETTVLLNLAYGNYYQTSYKDYYLKFEYTYNENIKNSMSRILTNSYYLNKVTCSTVLT